MENGKQLRSLVTYTISRILYQPRPQGILSRKRYKLPWDEVEQKYIVFEGFEMNIVFAFVPKIHHVFIAVIVRRDCYVFFGRFDNADYSSEMSLKIQQNVKLDIIKQSCMSYKSINMDKKLTKFVGILVKIFTP